MLEPETQGLGGPRWTDSPAPSPFGWIIRGIFYTFSQVSQRAELRLSAAVMCWLAYPSLALLPSGSHPPLPHLCFLVSSPGYAAHRKPISEPHLLGCQVGTVTISQPCREGDTGHSRVRCLGAGHLGNLPQQEVP